jgi:hypothetical protein
VRAAAVAVPCAGSLPGPRREAADTVDAACVRLWLTEVAARLEAERDFLTQLDAAIGDADHGVNMHRGFTAVMARIGAAQDRRADLRLHCRRGRRAAVRHRLPPGR